MLPRSPLPPRSRRRAAAVLLGLLALAGPGRAEEEGWAPGEVARVGDRTLTWEALARVALEEHAGDLPRSDTPAGRAVRERLDRILVRREAIAQGREPTPEAVTVHLEGLDDVVRARSGGREGLADVARARGMGEDDLLAAARHALRLEALTRHARDVPAGVEVLPRLQQEHLLRLRAAAVVEVARPLLWLVAGEGGETEAVVLEARDLPPGTFAVVETEALSELEAGEAILLAAGSEGGRMILDDALRAMLVEARGWALSGEALEEELAHQARIAEQEARFTDEMLWETARVVPGGSARRPVASAEDVRHARRARALLGLLRHQRAAVEDAAVLARYEAGRQGPWGPAIRVRDLHFEVAEGADVFTGRDAPSPAAAQAAAQRVMAALQDGASFEQVAEQVAQGSHAHLAPDRWLRADHRTGLLHAAVADAEDGEVVGPVSVLDGVHVLLRLEAVPAPTLEEAAPVLRERIARERTRDWLESRLADGDLVRVRWPLPPTAR